MEEKPEALRLTGPVEGRLQFENVCFHYDDAESQRALNDVDTLLDPGRTYALIGPSGAGKSTFINLVLRFYDPVSGRVLLDGKDLRELRLGDLRHQIALVPQDPVLFNDTIRENIRLSKPEATREEIEIAAKKANALSFIQATENGFETIVGDRGTRLSGGQKQRIAIARAFLRDAPLLILTRPPPHWIPKPRARFRNPCRHSCKVRPCS